jgi:hypothetical protein
VPTAAHSVKRDKKMMMMDVSAAVVGDSFLTDSWKHQHPPRLPLSSAIVDGETTLLPTN